MKFVVLAVRENLPDQAGPTVFLQMDDWDDYYTYSTLYHATFVDREGKNHRIGEVKIGQFDMEFGQRRPDLPDEFTALDERFFSLGQDQRYYTKLNAIGAEFRDEILQRLNDVAKDLSLFERALNEKVTGVSLLRGVAKSTVRGQFHRISNGGARLSEYMFSYLGPEQMDKRSPRISLAFEVQPGSLPPSNIHVLIGRNGVGKTHLLNAMARALVNTSPDENQVGSFEHNTSFLNDDLFANVVSVTFSAFDRFEPLTEPQNKSEGVRYSYIGLKLKGDPTKLKSTTEIAREFSISLKLCLLGARADRWRRALEMLETDPIFREAEISRLGDEQGKGASTVFGKMSSGHKIVLLTITKLVETVEERTLVLIDEPEAHLHPPLLSAFIRSLSDLLMDRNGVAIIATHSPVVLQEVPKCCVWKIRRTGGTIRAERPEIETFGENVGVLTREIFGLEVTHSGFHRVLNDCIEESDSYEEVLLKFENQLGDEAKAITRGLMATKYDD